MSVPYKEPRLEHGLFTPRPAPGGGGGGDSELGALTDPQRAFPELPRDGRKGVCRTGPGSRVTRGQGPRTAGLSEGLPLRPRTPQWGSPAQRALQGRRSVQPLPSPREALRVGARSGKAPGWSWAWCDPAQYWSDPSGSHLTPAADSRQSSSRKVPAGGLCAPSERQL